MNDSRYWSPLVPELIVSDFESSLGFYTSILGFNVLYRRDKPKFCYLDREHAQFMLQEIHEAYWKTGTLQYPAGRGVNFQIELSDIEAIHSRLLGAGYPLYRDIQTVRYAAEDEEFLQKEFLIQDPDGYLLRFCQQVLR